MGQLYGRCLLQIEGDYQKLQGKLQVKYGDRKEELSRWVDEWFERQDSEVKARGARANLGLVSPNLRGPGRRRISEEATLFSWCERGA
jgi:hypothetical protein